MSIIATYPSIAQLSQARKANQFSFLELACECYQKSQAVNQKLNCFINLADEDELKRKARVLDQNYHPEATGALQGIPIACKDNFLTTELPTTCASLMLKDFMATFDAFCLDAMQQDGALNMGKTNMDEFAMGSSCELSFFGACRNPWNHDFVPGGSSGGSACAVAADAIVMSLGTDTGGSVRQPAAFCGITGFKPSYGCISRRGIIAYASSLDQVGAMAHCAHDIALALNALARPDALDQTCSSQPRCDYTRNLDQPLKGLKIGIPSKLFDHPSIADGVKNCLLSALDTLKNECQCDWVDVDTPDFELALSCYYLIATSEAYSNLCRYDGIRYGYRANVSELDQIYSQTQIQGFGEEVNARIQLGRAMLSQENFDENYLKALKARHILAQNFAAAFKQCDVIALPVCPKAGFKLGSMIENSAAMSQTDLFTVPASLAGLPAISLPCGFSEGLPVGLQLVGPYWGEEILLRAGHQFQLQSSWHLQRPQHESFT